MSHYADILLPLALRGTFTYRVPEEWADSLKPGIRVVVQFGTRRSYTGIVTRLHDDAPQPGVRVKDISGVTDETPVLLPAQLELWRWMAGYYLCTEGEVMKAALPGGMKLESETLLTRSADFLPSAERPLTPHEKQIMSVLSSTGRGMRLAELERKAGAHGLLPAVRRLMETGAVRVHEVMAERFKPRTELRVRLAKGDFSEAAVSRTLDALRRAPAQEALLLRYLDLSGASAALTLHNAGLLKEVSRAALCEAPGADGALASLRRKGILQTYTAETGRLNSNASGGTGVLPEDLKRKPLSEQQRQAADAIRSRFAHKDVCLLHGVTSSGKTEIYMNLIEHTLAEGKQVLYLVPEIALTTQLTRRLARVFGNRMGVYHSKFPDAERVELWQRQLTPDAFPLILGVRSSIFLPFRRLGLVIVDEEHETSYKQQDPAPRYNARDAAIVMAVRAGAKVLLGTATPSLESYYNALRGKYGLVELTERYGQAELPEIVVEDVKELRRKKLMKTPFSPRLTDEVRTALTRGEQAILFQNRRGYSPVLSCHACGWTPRCTRCDVSLTFHQQQHRLVCHYCGTSYEVPTRCPACEGTELRDIGYGTEKIEAAAQSVFPTARTQRMDLDTTGTRAAHERIIDRFQRGETNLLIGTQMVTKGLDFDRVSVVGIMNADQMLNIPDFRAHERAFQMMSQVAGRAGRRGKRGLVVMQTRQPDLPVISQIVHGDYRAMFDEQLEERRFFHYPPVYRIVNVLLKHREESVVSHAAAHMAALLRPAFGDGLLGPDRPAVARIQRLFLRMMRVKLAPDASPAGVRRTLTAARDALLQLPAYKSVTVCFDVDPY